MSKLEFLNKLNPTQLEAVQSKSTSLQILAGPGSGKTRVLTSRVAWLVEEQYEDPARIVVVTFTVKAASEMRRRLESPDLLGKVKSDQLLMGTFHSVCNYILKKHGGLINLNRRFTVADVEVSKHIIRGLQKELANDLGEYAAKKMKDEAFYSEFSKHKNRGIDVNAYCEMYRDKPSKREFMIMFRAYEDRLLAENLVDFDNLLLFGREVIKRFPHVTSFVRHFLVDEFQDTNSVQYDIVRYATQAEGKSLTIVGDPDQSIFGWRNADRSNFLRMQNDFPNTEVIRLEENYRSTKSILAAALHVVAQDPERIPKSLFTDNVDGIPVSFLRMSSTDLEAETIAQEIERLVKYSKGLLTYKDFAILVRINFMTRSIEQSLSAINIPYVVVGGVRFFDRKEVKDIIAYVRFFYNPSDTTAFDRIINVPPRGVGEATLEKIRKLSRDHQLDVITVLNNVVNGEMPMHGLPARTKTNLKNFLQLCEEARKMMFAGQAISDILRYIVDAIEYHTYLRKTHEKEREGESRWANIGELISYAKLTFDPLPKDTSSKEATALEGLRLEKEEDLELFPQSTQREAIPSTTTEHTEQVLKELENDDLVARFLEATNLNAASKEQEEAEGGKVTINTMHSAKGLEWPIVFVIGCENGIIPHRKNDKDPWEENRLLYVSMTRAQCHLYCTYPLKRPDFGYSTKAAFSRFLENMPANLRMHQTPDMDASMRAMIASVTHRLPVEEDDPDFNSKGEKVWVAEETSSRDSRYGIPKNPPPIASSQSPKRSSPSQPYSTFSSAFEMHEYKRARKELKARSFSSAPTSLLGVGDALAFPSLRTDYEEVDILSSQSTIMPRFSDLNASSFQNFGTQPILANAKSSQNFGPQPMFVNAKSSSHNFGSQPVSDAFAPVLLQGIEDAVRNVISKGKRFTPDDVCQVAQTLLRKMNLGLAQQTIIENVELKLAEYVNQGHLEIVTSKNGRKYHIAED